MSFESRSREWAKGPALQRIADVICVSLPQPPLYLNVRFGSRRVELLDRAASEIRGALHESNSGQFGSRVGGKRRSRRVGRGFLKDTHGPRADREREETRRTIESKGNTRGNEANLPKKNMKGRRRMVGRGGHAHE